MQNIQLEVATPEVQKEIISEEDLNIISFYAKKYKVQAVYLFGSMLENMNQANDIDLAVHGIQPRLFFKFYGKLLRHLSKPVDLIDLSLESLFTQLVKEDGIKIYG